MPDSRSGVRRTQDGLGSSAPAQVGGESAAAYPVASAELKAEDSASSQHVATLLEWVVQVDMPAAAESVRVLTAKYPGASNAQLGARIFSKAQWKATAVGMVTGLPANPWVALPAATLDCAVTLKAEVQAAAETALIYDPTFFNEHDASWQLLVPIFGLNAASQVGREFTVRGSMGLSRNLIRTYVTKETLKQFKKIMLKYFGLKVTQKTFLTKTLPIIGGIVGGIWNWVELRLVRNRTISYFEDELPKLRRGGNAMAVQDQEI